MSWRNTLVSFYQKTLNKNLTNGLIWITLFQSQIVIIKLNDGKNVK